MLVPVNEFKWPAWGQEGASYTLTCKNHLSARYASKNPWTRNLHFLRGPKEHPFSECSCPFGDLVVLVDEPELESNGDS